MGMSTHVIGFRPPDEEWHRHKAVWDACKKAGVPVPDETDVFFDGDPDERGIEVSLDATKWEDEMREGVEIEVAKLPDSVTHIRFYNSW